jgi:class 3 adenylate cyclase
MQASFTDYDFTDSINRIGEILDSSDASYEGHEGIPSRDRLTFQNGFYVDVTVIFIDMRGSKALSENHKRPLLAKIYRAYISELVAVLKGESTISEIYIEGDGVWAVFNTTTKLDVNSVFSTAARVSSLIDILNIKLKKKGYSEVKVGIGIDDATTLYIKAGYKNSGINEVVWIGDLVGQAAALCKNGNREWYDRETMVSKRVYEMLNDHNKGLLAWSNERNCYHGYVVSTVMSKWVQDNG